MRLRSYFTGYAGSFETSNLECVRNIQLKIDHTLRVCAESELLAEAEPFSQTEKAMLFHAAMLHDFSRFEQIVRFRTMNDLESFDHGERSFELVSERREQLLGEFSSTEQQIILTAIRWHNRLRIPEGLSDAERKILNAVRDVDKMDIMKILIQYLKNPENPAIVYGLSKTDGLTDAVRDSLLAGSPPDNRLLRSSLDFLAAKFAWGYDLNFSWTNRMFCERRYMQILRSLLPQELDVLDEILKKVTEIMQKKGKDHA